MHRRIALTGARVHVMDYDSINQDTELGTLESVVEIGSCLEMNQENVGVMYIRKFSLYGI